MVVDECFLAFYPISASSIDTVVNIQQAFFSEILFFFSQSFF